MDYYNKAMACWLKAKGQCLSKQHTPTRAPSCSI